MGNRLATAVFSSAMAGAASAALAIPFAVVNINPVPDTLVQFDSSDPAGTQSVTLTFPTELIRGMDLTGPDTGWYVSTATTNGGFYRLNNGVSTLIGPLPFTSSDIGGLTFNQNESFLYYIIDEQGTPTDDVLYRVDFNGTFTRLGLLSGVPASPRFGGLATHPQTGVLYGMNMQNDALYTIDPTTLNATIVGTGLGVNLTNAVGGLDFTPDGRLFGTAFGVDSGTSSSLFEIDPTTGLAFPSNGTFGFITSSLAYVPEPSLAAALFAVAPLLLRRRLK